MTSTALNLRIRARPAVGLRGGLARIAAAIALWRQRARQRRHLAEMSPEMLRDIGVSVSAARAEAGKPFWMA